MECWIVGIIINLKLKEAKWTPCPFQGYFKYLYRLFSHGLKSSQALNYWKFFPTLCTLPLISKGVGIRGASVIILLLKPSSGSPGLKWNLYQDADPAQSLLWFPGLTPNSYNLWTTNHLVNTQNSHSSSHLSSSVQQNPLLLEIPSTWETLPRVWEETKIPPVPISLLRNDCFTLGIIRQLLCFLFTPHSSFPKGMEVTCLMGQWAHLV